MNIDYEDFPEGVPFLQAVTNENRGIFESPKKRYRTYLFVFMFEWFEEHNVK